MPRPSESPDPTKRQVNFYLETELDLETRRAVYERQITEPGYSRTDLFNEAMRTYFLALKYHREAKSDLSVYDFVLFAIKNFLGSKRK